LVGNPNSGKTTIFNHASGSHERVGNYSGVTVDAKKATFKQNGYRFNIIDLPGTYSLTSYTPEEVYVRNYIFENVPDVVVNIVDASNLERNLYLTTQLIDMGIKVVIGLNMFDELAKNGNRLDFEELGQMVGIPIIPTVGSKSQGIRELFDKIIDVYEDCDPIVRHIHINYGEQIEESIKAITSKIKIPENRRFTDIVAPRFLAIKLLENDKGYTRGIKRCVNPDEIKEQTKQEVELLENSYEDNIETTITDLRYGFISGALKETLKLNPEKRIHKTEIIDTFITHKVWGIPIFVFFMWLTFYSTFTLGKYPMQWIELLVDGTSGFLSNNLPDNMLKDFLVDGIIGGVGGVVVFLPNIILMFLFISLMEDTGYMARAVFIMDKAMHKIGLHGKSFIPLLMGFGCNVPAIMSTRIIESRRDRLITMLINPFMSCSARLPVYVLFIGAFFATNQGTILFSMYIIGVLLAIGTSLLFKKTIFKQVDVPFVMELPPYRTPTFRTILKHMWFRTMLFLKKISGIILIASIVIWLLSYFPRNIEYSTDYNRVEIELQDRFTISTDSLEKKEITRAIKQLSYDKESERQSKSYIGHIGQFIEPVMKPLGFDWKMSVGILTGIAGKEIVISTLGVLYQTEADEENTSSLVQRLQNQTHLTGEKKGEPAITPLVAFCFMLFILIYFPCISVIAAIKQESGGWKWALFAIFYTTGLAWIITFGVYQIGSLF